MVLMVVHLHNYDLLSSYRTDRSQYVEFSGHKSDTLHI